jgi:uncharacterized protein YdcH (DUF465 family)
MSSSVNNNGMPFRFHMGVRCSEHPDHQNKPSSIDKQNVKNYVDDVALKGGDAIYTPKQKKRAVGVIDCIECKTSAGETEKAHNNSKLTRALSALKTSSYFIAGASVGVSTVTTGSMLIAFILAVLISSSGPPMFAIATCCFIIFGALMATALVFGLAGFSFEQLESVNNSHHVSYLNSTSLINSMLSFMKDLAEKDQELKKLLSKAEMTDQGIKNLTNSITDQRCVLTTAYRKLCNLLSQIDNLKSTNVDNSVITDPVELNEINNTIEAKISEIEQQKVEAQDKFSSAVQELTDSLINNICENFEANEATLNKIKLSFLNACNNNQDDFNVTLTNIVNTCLSIKDSPDDSSANSQINKIIKGAVKDTIENLFNTRKAVRYTNKNNPIPNGKNANNLCYG